MKNKKVSREGLFGFVFATILILLGSTFYVLSECTKASIGWIYVFSALICVALFIVAFFVGTVAMADFDDDLSLWQIIVMFFVGVGMFIGAIFIPNNHFILALAKTFLVGEAVLLIFGSWALLSSYSFRRKHNEH